MSIFLDKVGDTPLLRILEYFLEFPESDHAVGDVIESIGMSRSTFYTAWPKLLVNGYVKKTRTVGKTNLYALDLTNPYAKRFAEMFDLALTTPRRRTVLA